MEILTCKALFARLRLDASSTLGRLASIARRRPAVTRCGEYLRPFPAFIFSTQGGAHTRGDWDIARLCSTWWLPGPTRKLCQGWKLHHGWGHVDSLTLIWNDALVHCELLRRLKDDSGNRRSLLNSFCCRVGEDFVATILESFKEATAGS